MGVDRVEKQLEVWKRGNEVIRGWMVAYGDGKGQEEWEGSLANERGKEVQCRGGKLTHKGAGKRRLVGLGGLVHCAPPDGRNVGSAERQIHWGSLPRQGAGGSSSPPHVKGVHCKGALSRGAPWEVGICFY